MDVSAGLGVRKCCHADYTGVWGGGCCCSADCTKGSAVLSLEQMHSSNLTVSGMRSRPFAKLCKPAQVYMFVCSGSAYFPYIVLHWLGITQDCWTVCDPQFGAVKCRLTLLVFSVDVEDL